MTRSLLTLRKCSAFNIFLKEELKCSILTMDTL
nr:MAG TPA: hypothetical protein [Caudoviricetes sp.]